VPPYDDVIVGSLWCANMAAADRKLWGMLGTATRQCRRGGAGPAMGLGLRLGWNDGVSRGSGLQRDSGGSRSGWRLLMLKRVNCWSSDLSISSSSSSSSSTLLQLASSMVSPCDVPPAPPLAPWSAPPVRSAISFCSSSTHLPSCSSSALTSSHWTRLCFVRRFWNQTFTCKPNNSKQNERHQSRLCDNYDLN